MHNLRRFYYQNKEKIWKVVLLIAFLLAIIYFLDESVGKQQQNNVNTITVNKQEIYSDEKNNTYISDKSAISGGTVSEQEVEKINNTVSKFLQYCKNGQYEEAYNMLSIDCKENGYATLEKFQNGYIKSRFSKDDVYEIEKWIRNTYRVNISKDLLATGNVNNTKQIEYITIVKENSEEKLNINSYIGKKEINKEVVQDNVKVTVIEKRIYMDYEIYDFKIENLSNKTIKVDSLEKTGTMHLKDSNGNKYNAYSHEIIEEELEIKSNCEFNFSIKYANSYSDRTSIEKIVFENVVLDYIEYKKTQNKEEFEDISKIEINV